MKLPTKKLEESLFIRGYDRVIGVDEVGMGCLAGPVVVCAVSFKPEFYSKSHRKLHGLRDSKLLSPEKREVFADRLKKEKQINFAICHCRPETIGKLNVYQAARKAMKRAVKKLVSSSEYKVLSTKRKMLNTKCLIQDTVVLVDGPHKISKLNIEQIPVVGGDRKVFAIACASVLAKTFRDKMMRRYAKKYPDYGFEKHKGYGTKYHQAQLAAMGPCEIHRKSFRLDY